MRSLPIQLSSFDGLSWNQKASLRIEGGPTYDEIILDTEGTITDPAQIVRWGINLNGEEIMYGTGEDLKMLESYRGLYGEDDKFCISFEDISNRTENGQVLTSLVTLAGDNITLTVEIGSFETNATDPLSLRAFARASASQGVRRFIPRLQTLTFNASAVGENDFSTLVRGPRVRSIHFKTANMSGLRVLRDRIEVVEKLPVDVNNMFLRRYGRSPQAGYFHFDPIATQFGIRDLFATQVKESLVFKIDVTAAETVRMLVSSVQALSIPEGRRA